MPRQAVYQLFPDGKYQWLTTLKKSDLSDFSLLYGTDALSFFENVALKRVSTDPEGNKLQLGDFLHVFPYAFAVTEKAETCLAEVAQTDVQFVTLGKVDSGQFKLVNPLILSDALNLQESEISFFSSSARIKRICSYVFYPERLSGTSIFRISHFPVAGTFITQQLFERIETFKLRGLRALQVWRET